MSCAMDAWPQNQFQMKGRIMPNSKKPTRTGGTKPAAQVTIPSDKPGVDPAQLKRKGRSQRSGRGKPPRFPGRTGGR